ncbi:MAG: acyl-CoA dehydrogenase family protein [Chloroflexi bacterium]|nr:acyl-CoA dehydrogenase family protein [Chloroflexota bacterium]MCI0800339.1 acyl-CoA dehydrogenase family protein [Chloroflexota bacterium]MCI0846881.1 acyl-CoA dehydrogenase family protein [Chloroflexota bacterium]MCI0862668.1 acyl-CoA dehydrogenase family protein [Chloroflexota bacterium]MCI0898105.1 acyl-CoA dehydrogenase family protein [Chloroflexota bacterium]
MQAGLPPELDALKHTIRQVVKDECYPLEAQFLANPSKDGVDEPGAPRGIAEALSGLLGVLPEASWDRLNKISKDTGIYTSFVPEEYGGGGMGALGHVVLDEEIHKSIVQLPTSPVPMMMIGAATPEQEQEYLIPSVEGKLHYAFGQTEPNAGSDPGGMMQTRAVLDGDDWVINGTKTFISGAASADYILVQAVTDPEKRQRGGITMFIIDNPSPGLSFDPIRLWINPTKAQQYTVNLDNIRVPRTKVLGEVGQGFTLGQQWLVHHDRLLRGSMATGILSRALEMAIEWAKERVTYGQPIADRQAIQYMLTDVYTDIITLRATTREIAKRADAGDDVRVEASMIKYCAGEWGWRSIDKIMQVFGGTGETLDLPIAHWYHILRHARIGGGTSEIHKFVMARGLLDGRVDFQG